MVLYLWKRTGLIARRDITMSKLNFALGWLVVCCIATSGCLNQTDSSEPEEIFGELYEVSEDPLEVSSPMEEMAEAPDQRCPPDVCCDRWCCAYMYCDPRGVCTCALMVCCADTES